MQKKLNTILVGCDSKTKAARLEKLFDGFDPPVEVTVADNIDKLLKLLKKKLPDVIVLHTGKKDTGYIDWLKKIRKVKGIDEVPVIIHTGKEGKRNEGLVDLVASLPAGRQA